MKAPSMVNHLAPHMITLPSHASKRLKARPVQDSPYYIPSSSSDGVSKVIKKSQVMQVESRMTLLCFLSFYVLIRLKYSHWSSRNESRCW
ncbi:flagellar export protein FliJ [Sesbania bispinosa]|nr:flagellar export protein FliJ [Sesbania bispinosa]